MADFWSWVDKTDPNGCWLWTGYVSHYGYGSTHVARKTRFAHRVAYELTVGPIPEGLTLDHLCRVRHCVNPSHLEPVTVVENVMRGTNFMAVNAAKTHCSKGHPFTEDNTYRQIRASGAPRRACRECKRIFDRRKYASNPPPAYLRSERRRRQRARERAERMAA